MIVSLVDDQGLYIEPVILDSIPFLMEKVPETITDPETGERKEIMVEKPLMQKIEEMVTDPETGEQIPSTREEPVPDWHYVTDPCPDGFFWPKRDFVNNIWVEGGQAPEPVPAEPTIDERVSALEKVQMANLLGGTV